MNPRLVDFWVPLLYRLNLNPGVVHEITVGVAVYRDGQLAGYRVSSLDRLQRHRVPLLPSQISFPANRGRLIKCLGSMSNAMSSVTLGDPLWISRDISVTNHLDSLSRHFLADGPRP